MFSSEERLNELEKGLRLDRLLVADDPHRQGADRVADETHQLRVETQTRAGSGDRQVGISGADRVDHLARKHWHRGAFATDSLSDRTVVPESDAQRIAAEFFGQGTDQISDRRLAIAGCDPQLVLVDADVVRPRIFGDYMV